MIACFTDVAAIERAWLFNRMYLRTKLGKRRFDASHFAHSTGRTRSRDYRATVSHHRRVFNKSRVRISFVSLQPR